MDFIRRFLGFWFFVLTLSVLLYFCLSNIEHIYIQMPHIGSFKMRAGYAFFTVFVAGTALSGLWFSGYVFKRHLKLRKLSRKVDILTKELENLKGARKAGKSESL